MQLLPTSEVLLGNAQLQKQRVATKSLTVQSSLKQTKTTYGKTDIGPEQNKHVSEECM